MELGSLILDNNRGSLYEGQMDGFPALIQLTLGFETLSNTLMDWSNPFNPIK